MPSRWYVVETKYASEASAAENLAKQGFRTIYPEILVKRTVRGQKVEICRPLFRGYIFVQFDREVSGWKRIHSTRGVQRLFGGNTPWPLPAGEAERLLERCDAGPVVEDEFPGLVIGKWVRGGEGSGWLEGRSVKVVRFTAAGRVGVLMAIMGKECLVEVPKAWLEAV